MLGDNVIFCIFSP